MHARARQVIAAGAVLSLPLAGCATVSSRIPVDSSDTCEQYRQPLREAEEQQQDLMAKWVAGGVVAGLVTGGTCALTGGKAALCAPIGAAILIGAVVGGYMQQKSKEANNQADLQRAIDNDSGAFGEQLNGLGVAAHSLNQCRQQQITTITKRYRTNQIDRQTAHTELASVDVKLGQDQELVNAFLGEMNKRTDLQVKARAASENLPPERYIAQIDQASELSEPAAVPQLPDPIGGARPPPEEQVEQQAPRPAAQKMRGNDSTQKTYNINKSVQQRAQSDMSQTQRLLSQSKELLG